MANVNVRRGVIGILTGGGDVPGLNPAIRAVTIRALREGYDVIGIASRVGRISRNLCARRTTTTATTFRSCPKNW